MNTLSDRLRNYNTKIISSNKEDDDYLGSTIESVDSIEGKINKSNFNNKAIGINAIYVKNIAYANNGKTM